MKKKHAVLVVDDHENIRKIMCYNVEKMGYEVDSASDGLQCLQKLESGNFSAVLMDVSMPNMNGMEALKVINEKYSDTSVIMVTAMSDVSMAVQAVKLGAYEYITKPVDFDRLETDLRNAIKMNSLKEELQHLKDEIQTSALFTNIIGQSDAMSGVFTMANKILNVSANVLIIGESGTGKEVMAQAIHDAGSRSSGPFVPVNSAAINKELADSLLFGHKKGSFTGANEDRAGYFEQADGGTIFLDEIGDMDLDLQAKVLRVLEERTVRRVGEKQERKVDFRVISATNRDLIQAIGEGKFRKDLYYRLEEYPVFLPPLRDRQSDIILLAQHFLDGYCKENRLEPMTFSSEVKDHMRKHPWPGNIRELRNVVRRAAIQASDNVVETITFSKVDADIKPAVALSAPITAGEERIVPMDQMERQAIESAFQSTNQNVIKAAQQLGISRATMYRKLKQYDIET